MSGLFEFVLTFVLGAVVGMYFERRCTESALLELRKSLDRERDDNSMLVRVIARRTDEHC